MNISKLVILIAEETVSLESPPPESNNHNISDLLSQVLPEDEIRRNAAVAALAAAAEQKQLEMAAAGMSLQQRAPGSQLGNRNGSMTVLIVRIPFQIFLSLAILFFQP